MTTQPPSHEEVQRVLAICSVRRLSCIDPNTGVWIDVNAMLESLLADNVRQSAEIERLRDYQVTLVERIAALEKEVAAYRETMECNDPLNSKLIALRFNPQCSGTATGRQVGAYDATTGKPIDFSDPITGLKWTKPDEGF